MLKHCIIIITLIKHCGMHYPLSFRLASNVKDIAILSFRRAILLHILSRGSTQPFRRAILLYILSGGPYVYTSFPEDIYFYTSLPEGFYFYTFPEGYTSVTECIVYMFRAIPFNLFFPVFFLFDWVGVLWPNYLRC